jgi:hypothetical protein
MDKIAEQMWVAVTEYGKVYVWASSELQARNRAKWKAVHQRFKFSSPIEAKMAVRECSVHECAKVF